MHSCSARRCQAQATAAQFSAAKQWCSAAQALARSPPRPEPRSRSAMSPGVLRDSLEKSTCEGRGQPATARGTGRQHKHQLDCRDSDGGLAAWSRTGNCDGSPGRAEAEGPPCFAGLLRRDTGKGAMQQCSHYRNTPPRPHLQSAPAIHGAVEAVDGVLSLAAIQEFNKAKAPGAPCVCRCGGRAGSSKMSEWVGG